MKKFHLSFMALLLASAPHSPVHAASFQGGSSHHSQDDSSVISRKLSKRLNKSMLQSMRSRDRRKATKRITQQEGEKRKKTGQAVSQERAAKLVAASAPMVGEDPVSREAAALPVAVAAAAADMGARGSSSSSSSSADNLALSESAAIAAAGVRGRGGSSSSSSSADNPSLSRSAVAVAAGVGGRGPISFEQFRSQMVGRRGIKDGKPGAVVVRPFPAHDPNTLYFESTESIHSDNSQRREVYHYTYTPQFPCAPSSSFQEARLADFLREFPFSSFPLTSPFPRELARLIHKYSVNFSTPLHTFEGQRLYWCSPYHSSFPSTWTLRNGEGRYVYKTGDRLPHDIISVYSGEKFLGDVHYKKNSYLWFMPTTDPIIDERGIVFTARVEMPQGEGTSPSTPQQALQLHRLSIVNNEIRQRAIVLGPDLANPTLHYMQVASDPRFVFMTGRERYAIIDTLDTHPNRTDFTFDLPAGRLFEFFALEPGQVLGVGYSYGPRRCATHRPCMLHLTHFNIDKRWHHTSALEYNEEEGGGERRFDAVFVLSEERQLLFTTSSYDDYSNPSKPRLHVVQLD